MKYHPPAIAIILGLLVMACDGYISFGDELVLPDEELPASDELVINAMLINTDTTFYLRSDRAISFQRGYPIRPEANQASWPIVDEDDLDINLRADGEAIATFRHIPEAERIGSRSVFDTVPWTDPVYPGQVNYRAPTAGSVLEAGSSYRLSIDHPRLGEFNIDQRMPRAVTGAEARVSGLLSNSSGSSYRTVSLTFDDPPGEDNFYLIQATTSEPEAFPLTLTDADPRTPEGERLRAALFFTDSTADGRTVLLDFIASTPSGEDIGRVTVTTVSAGWYRFMESYQRYFELRQDLDDGLVEPFQLYTNIPGGFGYFGLGNEVTVSLK